MDICHWNKSRLGLRFIIKNNQAKLRKRLNFPSRNSLSWLWGISVILATAWHKTMSQIPISSKGSDVRGMCWCAQCSLLENFPASRRLIAFHLVDSCKTVCTGVHRPGRHTPGNPLCVCVNQEQPEIAYVNYLCNREQLLSVLKVLYKRFV